MQLQYENNPDYWGVYSFAGGPTQLPRQVLHKIDKEFYKSDCKSILEFNKHEYHEILDKAISQLQSMLNIPDQYKILFCSGGASLLFEAIPMNLLSDNSQSSPTYAKTGYWSQKALDEATKIIDNVQIATKIAQNEHGQLYVPELDKWTIDKDSPYLHYCDNETVEGLEYPFIPKLNNIPVVTDMSSNFLTKQLDWNKLDFVYAHAQKNIGIAGSALMILKPELIKNKTNIPYMWDFKEMLKKQSIINNIPIFPIYVNTLMFDWLQQQGTVSQWDEYCKARSQKIYKIIDNSHGIFQNYIQKDQRSRINVTFTLKNENETNLFIEKCKQNGIIEIKGHRAYQGCRICLYLPIPEIAIDKLCQIMEDYI